MDEPFSAIDPIARGRLQREFLRVQRTVRKTIVFVTHDLDEAVLLADRVAVLGPGGVLEQHAPPADVLGAPASPFVADFVGAERGLRRLGVTPIDVTALEDRPVICSPDGAPKSWDDAGTERELPGVVEADATLKQVLAQVLSSDAGWVAVVEPGSGRYLGGLSAASVHAALRHSVAAQQPGRPLS